MAERKKTESKHKEHKGHMKHEPKKKESRKKEHSPEHKAHLHKKLAELERKHAEVHKELHGVKRHKKAEHEKKEPKARKHPGMRKDTLVEKPKSGMKARGDHAKIGVREKLEDKERGHVSKNLDAKMGNQGGPQAGAKGDRNTTTGMLRFGLQ